MPLDIIKFIIIIIIILLLIIMVFINFFSVYPLKNRRNLKKILILIYDMYINNILFVFPNSTEATLEKKMQIMGGEKEQR